MADKTAQETKVVQDKGRSNLQWVFWAALSLCLVVPVFLFVRLPETPIERARSLVKAGKTASALPLLEDIARKEPDNHEIMPWLALCYLSTDRLAEGRTALDTAMKARLPCSTLRPAIDSYIQYYEQKHDFNEALRLLQAVQPICPSEDLEATKTHMYLVWSEHDASESKLDAAVAHLEQGVAGMPEGEPRTRSLHRLAEYYRQLAATREVPQSIQLLEKSLTLTDEPASRMDLADLYTKSGQPGKALEHLKQVSLLDPNNLEARHKSVELCLTLDDLKGAQQALLELAEKERCVENYTLLSEICLRLENHAAAVRALEEASDLSRGDAAVLTKLHESLVQWSEILANQKKFDESQQVKVRAERIAEKLKEITGITDPDKKLELEANAPEPGPAINLVTSRIWLSRGSFTPEGEIGVKNTGSEPITELSMTMVFYDNTSRRRIGAVTVSAASQAHPMTPGQIRTIYFSSPTTVRAEHKLCVLIFRKGKLIRELPVVKER